MPAVAILGNLDVLPLRRQDLLACKLTPFGLLSNPEIPVRLFGAGLMSVLLRCGLPAEPLVQPFPREFVVVRAAFSRQPL